jgi:NAD(P)-dependent dehydrogenase (short-subunit alcohol dehydrogenase family)
MRHDEQHTCILKTGASSGIGRQLAMDYADDGCIVWACGRDGDRLNQLADHSANIRTLQFDVCDLHQSRQALLHLDPVPSLWLLNAGDCGYLDGGIMDATLLRRIIEVNLIGVANCVEAGQVHFRRGHRLAMVGSIASELALPRAEAYGASKAAVSYLSRSLALGLKPQGVRVSTVFPGFVATPLTDRNTFAMPMIIDVRRASSEIRYGLRCGRSAIYFPRRFTLLIRAIGLLPYAWQGVLVDKLLRSH